MAGVVIEKLCLKYTVRFHPIRGADGRRRRSALDRTGSICKVVKQREKGRVIGTETRVIYGDEQLTPRLLGEHTAYVERTNLTTRHMNGRLVRKTLGFSKKRATLKAACIWEDVVYNFARQVKTLRVEVNDGHRRWLPRSPAMAAGITDHIWTIEELLTRVPINTNT
jgi:hypothetical protein